MENIYVKDLGKCVAKTEDGRYRAFAEGNLYRIYSVGREMLWDGDSFLGYGKKLTAVPVGYFQYLENFEYAVMECKSELNYLMKEGA